MKRNRLVPLIIVVVLTIGFGILLTLKIGNVYAQKSVSRYEYLEIFADALDIIDKNYVEKVDMKQLVQGAIKGMLQELDPHSSYMDSNMFKEFQDETKGEFGGLGITIGLKDKVLTVISPIEDTPAYKVGIKAGDKIIKIEGKSTMNLPLEDAVRQLRGKPGTSVVITISRSGTEKPFDVTIVRDIIKVKTVKSIKNGDIGYIRLTQFNEKASQEVKSALDKLKKENVKGIIIDLRNNPGGLLNEAIAVSNIFLQPNKTVVFTKERNEKDKHYKTTDVQGSDTEILMTVLINEGSASASEIFAGAIQDYKRGVVIGKTSFGKASVQTIMPLSDGSAVKVTTARYYTPNGRSIQGVGIVPDIAVEQGEIVYKDKQNFLKEKDLDNHLVGENEKSSGKSEIKAEQDNSTDISIDKVDFEKDLQLKFAFDILKGFIVYGKGIKNN